MMPRGSERVLLLLLPTLLLLVGPGAAQEGGRVEELVFPLRAVGGAVVLGAPHLTPQAPLSLCFWLKAALQTAAARILSYFRNDTVIFITRSGSMISVRTESQLIDVRDFELTPRVWHQMCVVRHQQQQVELLLDGRSFTSSSYTANDSNVADRTHRNRRAINTMISIAENIVGLNFTDVPIIVLGALESLANSPVGRMADVMLFKRILTTEEMRVLRTCTDQAPVATDLKVVYTTDAVVTRSIKRQSLCKNDKVHVVTYPAYTRQPEAEALCSKLGGSLPAPQNFEDFINTADIVPEYSGRSEMFFWLSNSTNFTAISVNENYCCAQELRHGGSLPMSAPCNSWARDFVCYVTHDKSVYLLHVDSEIELFYGDVRENYMLISDQGYSLSFEEDRFIIHNMMAGVLGFRIGRQISDVLGIHEWKVNSSKDTTVVTISTCLPEEFTCRNGDCLPLEKRCDKLPDCDDASDEDDCRFLLPPPVTYRSLLPPSENTTVGLNVNITDIHDINMKENQLEITMEVRLVWTDGRLTFTNMANKTRLDEALGRIWHPSILCAGAKYEDNVNLQKGVNDMRTLYAEPSSRGTPDVVNSSRALKQAGRDVRLLLHIILDLTVTCSYDLTLYPFDLQACGLNLTLGPELTGSTRWDAAGHLRINRFLRQPALYGVTNLRLRRISGTKVAVEILLERWFGSYMLTSYLPCLILLVIGTSTLAYPVSAVSDRVMVTLSCLIVLSSLLAQASATLPESASSKAIEVWFFYTIARMFLVSMVHTAVYRSNHKSSVAVVSISGGKKPRPRTWAARSLQEAWAARAAQGLTPTERINRFGLVLGLFLDLVFFAVYVSYVVTIRSAVFAAHS